MQIEQIAKEAHHELVTKVYAGHTEPFTPWLLEFAKLVAEEAAKREREACAKVCEEEGKLWSKAGCTDTQTFGLCATVIRARGEAWTQ